MNPQEVLSAAADLIEERGWWDGKGWPKEGVGLCAFTAIWTVAAGRPQVSNRMAAARLLADRIAPEIIADWNDSQPDAASVIRVLRGDPS